MNSPKQTVDSQTTVHYLGNNWRSLCGNVHPGMDGEISLISDEVTCDACKELVGGGSTGNSTSEIVYPTFAHKITPSPATNHPVYDEIQTFTHKVNSPTSDAYLGRKLSEFYASGWTILSSNILPIFPPTNIPHILFILSRPKV